MTANQIAYNRMLEEGRTHRVQEAETQRSNLAREIEQSRANTLNYNASIYASDTSRRNAEIAADTQRYAASLNYASSIYATNANVAQRNKEMWTNYEINKFQRAETERHNVAMEKIERQKAETGQVRTGIDFLNSLGKLVSIGATMA